MFEIFAVLLHQKGGIVTQHLGAFDGLATHEDARVRARVADALGKLPGDAPPDALVGLLGDEDAIVQRGAVRAASPDERVYLQLAEKAMTGGLADLNVRPVLDLVKHGRSEHRAVTDELLDALIESGIEDDGDRQLAYTLRAR